MCPGVAVAVAGGGAGPASIWRDEPPMTIRRSEFADVDLSDVTTGERLAPVSPGVILEQEFMEPMGLSARALARDMHVPPNRITGILHGERAITAETAILLA